MKVLVSAYACNPSGSLKLHPGEDLTGWQIVKQIARFHDLWVITHTYNREGVDAAPKTPGLGRVRFHFLELPRWLRWLYKIEFGQRIYYFLWQFSAWRLAKKLNKEVAFDIAHHATFGNDWIASFIGAYLPVPFVWGPVGGGQRTPRPLLREYTLYGRFAEAFRNAAQWVGRRMIVRRICLKNTKAFLICNNETRTRIPARYLGKTFYFPVNGISAEDVRTDLPAPRGAEAPFKVLTAGRLHRLKGFALAVKAFAQFASENPASEMTIIGKGPEEESLQGLIQGLGLQDKVHIVPWLPRAEVLAQMRGSDVFLFPSFRDGGGAVVVEAMASALPVIVLDSGGPGAHVHGDWGIKVPQGSPETISREMAQSLAKLAGDRDFARRMGISGLKRVKEFYLWDRLGERMQEIYTFALGGPKPSDMGRTD
jgi:glycosyltransferase involved in cell wall biosynthesis